MDFKCRELFAGIKIAFYESFGSVASEFENESPMQAGAHCQAVSIWHSLDVALLTLVFSSR